MESSGLSPMLIDELIKKGFNQSQIAAMFGVTRQAVNKKRLSNEGHYRTPREIVMDRFPWKPVAEKFTFSSTYNRMRNHAEFIGVGDKNLSEDLINRLNNFYDRLENENVVVEFDPDIPPTEENSPGGFALRERESSDGDLIIRVNEYVRPEALDQQGRMIWRMPDRRPEYRGNDK